jgi:hypothetical protein
MKVRHDSVDPPVLDDLHQCLDRIAEAHSCQPADLLGGQPAVRRVGYHRDDRGHAATFSHPFPMRKVASAAESLLVRGPGDLMLG